MMYNKPKNVSYTDMAIFIDNHAYSEDCTEEDNLIIFEYIYHIAEMLAYKAKFFQSNKTYDEFALYVATDVYMRLKNKKQFQFNETGEPKLRKIKSILNYIKKVLYPKKVDFLQEHYDQSFRTAEISNESINEYSFADSLIDSLDDIQKIDFSLCLGDIIKTIKSYVYSLPFKNDQVFCLNLYFSCLLTFLSSITPNKNEIQRYQKLKMEQHKQLSFAELIQDDFSLSDVMLYHINESYKKYVFLLTKRIKHIIANDLAMVLNSEVFSQSTLKTILVQEILKTTIQQERQNYES